MRPLKENSLNEIGIAPKSKELRQVQNMIAPWYGSVYFQQFQVLVDGVDQSHPSGRQIAPIPPQQMAGSGRPADAK
jgi:hypothetical protein